MQSRYSAAYLSDTQVVKWAQIGDFRLQELISAPMYRIQHNSQIALEDFHRPFGSRLNPENRWVVLTGLLPWKAIEEKDSRQFNPTMGAPAKPFRMALGALSIKGRLGMTDSETVQQITENPFMHYFVGLEGYCLTAAPFDPSILLYFC